jgi:Rieske Fe-S protein
MDPNQTSRRNLLQLGLATGAASVLGGCRSFGSRKPDATATAKDNQITLGKEESAQLLAAEGSLLVERQGTRDQILVVHARDGRLHALSPICTHKGCTVLYDEKLGHIRCPCHGSQYSLDGRNLKGPAQQPLRPYGIRDDNGLVVITL